MYIVRIITADQKANKKKGTRFCFLLNRFTMAMKTKKP